MDTNNGFVDYMLVNTNVGVFFEKLGWLLSIFILFLAAVGYWAEKNKYKHNNAIALSIAVFMNRKIIWLIILAILGVTFLGIGWYSKDLKEKQAQNDF